MPRTRAELLAEAQRREQEAQDIARRIEEGETCLDSTLEYRRATARRLRWLAADTPDA